MGITNILPLYGQVIVYFIFIKDTFIYVKVYLHC